MTTAELVRQLRQVQSMSIVGMCKNAGKTTMLNWLLAHTGRQQVLGLTSIGRDGESTDVVTGTEKPSIFVPAGTLIATAKDMLRLGDVTQEILVTTGIPTPLGEVIIMRARSDGYVQLAAGSIKNSTEHPDADLRAAVTTQSLPFAIEKNSGEPQILIMHTHATESYQTWPDPVFDENYTARSKNTALNMVAVGAEMARVLNAAGIKTLHDTTLYDAPGYTSSYQRSRAGVQDYLARYPSIKIVLDVHRDAIEDSDGTRVKPVCEIDGESTAQVMVIAGCDNGGSAALPNWRLNLRFAAAWEAAMEGAYPGLTRPVLCGYRFYNQDLTTGSLLIEIGGHANTLDEALRAGRYAAEGLVKAVG